MDGFKKNHSSSPSTKLSATPKLSSPDLQPRTCYFNDVGMSNEENQSVHQMGSKLQSPKHFMSHTISTASKAASVKKVLGERNEQSGAIISATHVEKSPVSNRSLASADVGYNDLDRYSRLTPKMSSRVSDLDQENISDPSSQPYDPLTNYLSPRPKFLRYRPNRRHEFLRHRENERATEENGLKCQESVEGEESNQSVDADESSSSSSAKCSLESECNFSDDDEDMEEFEEDEKQWNFNMVFKSLFLLGILILSTVFMSSMNSPTPPPYIQVLQEVRECYQKAQEYLFRVTMVSNFLDQDRENPVSVTTNGNSTVTPEGIHEEEMIFSIGMKVTWENFYLVAKESELQQLENETQSVPDSQTQFMSHWVEKQSAGSDIFNSFEIQKNLDEGTETVMAEQEKEESVTEASGGASNGGTLKKEIDLRREFVIEWIEEVENISGKTSKTLEPLDGENTEIHQVSQTQLISGTKAIEHAASDDIHITDGTKVDVEEEDQIKAMKSEFIARAAVVVSVIAISMVLGLLHLKNRKTVKGSHLRVQSSSESMEVEKRNSELQPSESMAKGDSLINLSPSVLSKDKAVKELHQSGVPKVELLGEFTMGEIRRSSIKICDLKHKKVEGEVTNFSAPQDKRPRRKILNEIHLSPAASSATEFSSYGSFTAQENIVKKEEDNDGEEEVRKTIRTPVRRSNRIRNRVMSP